MIEGARRKSVEIGEPLRISIAYALGDLVALDRIDVHKVTRITMANDKVFTGAVARKATHGGNTDCVHGTLAFSIHTDVYGRIGTVFGGRPVVIGGGVAGGSA
ncbi:heme-binding protein [Haliea sp. E1-2-M8]|uniref:heme-binding protein n=1 Tax=Haliea sp. E1-2-M8 TaxID=3064706 RepID=UPI00271AB52C|nr:heme-binding protein [Haliea sp. E1-2-M8]MDO8863808.1 heme-binding protein [Haliea sp. E1-2-M8]